MLHCEAALTVRANCWFHCGFTVGSSAYWVVQRVGQDTRQDSNRAWYVCVCVCVGIHYYCCHRCIEENGR